MIDESRELCRHSIELAFQAGCLSQTGQLLELYLKLCTESQLEHVEDHLLLLLTIVVRVDLSNNY